MSDSQNAGFAKFVPGFDFLQNLANWIAPTLNEEELEKRIAELKAVHFWLDQNSKALGATVQALEVQKMTLATLKGMNFNMGDVANAFKLKAADTVASGMQKVSEKAAVTVKTVAEVAEQTEEVAKKVGNAAKPAAAAAAAGLVDPMQLWTSLTQQFQHIAAGAMKEASKATAMDMGQNLAKEAVKATKSAMTGATVKKVPSKKAAPAKAAKKAAAKTPARRR